ncbi:hypothetical protein PGB90_009272 [Kerria lacca]
MVRNNVFVKETFPSVSKTDVKKSVTENKIVFLSTYKNNISSMGISKSLKFFYYIIVISPPP